MAVPPSCPRRAAPTPGPPASDEPETLVAPTLEPDDPSPSPSPSRTPSRRPNAHPNPPARTPAPSRSKSSTTSPWRSRRRPRDRPTGRPRPGIPIFDDDGDVSWLAKRAEKPPPPPPFDAIPERPLFAPDPADGSPVRRPRVPAGHHGGPHAGTGPGGYWPWDTSTGTGAPVIMSGSGIIEPVEETTRSTTSRAAAGCGWPRWWRPAAGAARDRGRLQPRPGPHPAGRRARARRARAHPRRRRPRPPRPAARRIDGVTATDFDPQGEDLRGDPRARAAGRRRRPRTAWRTQTYLQTARTRRA